MFDNGHIPGHTNKSFRDLKKHQNYWDFRPFCVIYLLESVPKLSRLNFKLLTVGQRSLLDHSFPIA